MSSELDLQHIARGLRADFAMVTTPGKLKVNTMECAVMNGYTSDKEMLLKVRDYSYQVAAYHPCWGNWDYSGWNGNLSDGYFALEIGSPMWEANINMQPITAYEF